MNLGPPPTPQQTTASFNFESFVFVLFLTHYMTVCLCVCVCVCYNYYFRTWVLSWLLLLLLLLQLLLLPPPPPPHPPPPPATAATAPAAPAQHQQLVNWWQHWRIKRRWCSTIEMSNSIYDLDLCWKKCTKSFVSGKRPGWSPTLTVAQIWEKIQAIVWWNALQNSWSIQSLVRP